MPILPAVLPHLMLLLGGMLLFCVTVFIVIVFAGTSLGQSPEQAALIGCLVVAACCASGIAIAVIQPGRDDSA